MSLSDKLLVVFVILWLAITGAFFWARLAIWGWLWLIILASVGVAELISKVRQGTSITTAFKRWAAVHRMQAVLLIITMASVWALLLLHLVL